MASCTSPGARLYFTDGSVGVDGTAFVCGASTGTRRLPHYTTAFQGELTAILLALIHACERGHSDIYLFTDSLSALHALRNNAPGDNVHLLCAVHFHLALLHRGGSDCSFHWIPGQVAVAGNDNADGTARLAAAGQQVNFHILRSASSIKRAIDAAAISATRNNFVTAMEEGSRSALWYATATGRERFSFPSDMSPRVAINITRLRLGYMCSQQILHGNLNPCPHCLEEENYPLLHNLLRCPATVALR